MRDAIFYIASADYREEAIKSLSSIRAHPMNDHCQAFLFTETPFHSSPFTEEILCPSGSHALWYVRSVVKFVYAAEKLFERQFDRALYLDTDTWVCGSLGELFDILDQFHFAAAHAPGRCTRPTILPIPRSFPEFNVGVNVFRLDGPTIKTLIDWRERMRSLADFYGNNDQPALRETLWLNPFSIRVATLAPEFNFRFGFGGFLRGPCLILHGRAPNVVDVARRVNSTNDFRTYRRGELA